MVRQAGFILCSAVGAGAAASGGQKVVRRINLQKFVLAGMQQQQNVSRCRQAVRPAGRIRRGGFLFLVFLPLFGCELPVGRNPSPSERYAVDPHTMHDHCQSPSYGNLSTHLAPPSGDLNAPSL